MEPELSPSCRLRLPRGSIEAAGGESSQTEPSAGCPCGSEALPREDWPATRVGVWGDYYEFELIGPPDAPSPPSGRKWPGPSEHSRLLTGPTPLQTPSHHLLVPAGPSLDSRPAHPEEHEVGPRRSQAPAQRDVVPVFPEPGNAWKWALEPEPRQGGVKGSVGQ